MPSSPTLGFSLSPDDQARVRNLADIWAHGNRSEWLRQATDLFETWAVFQTLARVQARGAQLAAFHGIDRQALPAVMQKAAEAVAEGASTEAADAVLAALDLPAAEPVDEGLARQELDAFLSEA